MSERLIIEIACAGLVFVGSLVLTQVFHFSPLMPSAKGFNAISQAFLFTLLPMAVYVVSRLYFTGTLVGLEAAIRKLPHNFRNWSTAIWRLAAFVIMYVGILAATVSFPSSKDIFAEIWKSAVGQLPTMVMDHTKTERAKFFERGQKFFGS